MINPGDPKTLSTSDKHQPFHLTITATTGQRHLPFLRRHLKRAHAMLPRAPREISLTLIGDKRMSRLHEQFMGISGPTDVLTFPLDENARGDIISGAIAICVPEARRQSASRGIAVERELLLYALHGLLHLCGFDDRTDKAFSAMHRKEDQILTRLGVGALFNPRAENARPPRKTGVRR